MLREGKGLLDPVSSPKGTHLNTSAFNSPTRARPSSPATNVHHRRQSTARETKAKSTREPTRTTFAVDPPGGEGREFPIDLALIWQGLSSEIEVIGSQEYHDRGTGRLCN